MLLACLLCACQQSETSAEKADVVASSPQATPENTAAANAVAVDSTTLRSGLQELVLAHRQLIVLFAEPGRDAAEQDVINQVGQYIFHENQARLQALLAQTATLADASNTNWFAALDDLLVYVESADDLFDADRLAFREWLLALESSSTKSGTLPAIKLHKRIVEDLDALNEIERLYDKEIKQIFSRFETRAIVLRRERWQEYLAQLKARLSRDDILKQYGHIMPYPTPAERERVQQKSIFGRTLPEKTVVLSFDDGPHASYTSEIAAILKRYNAPAVFFHVGKNLGTVDKDGIVTLSKRAEISRQLAGEGFTLANHTYSHAQLSKETGESLKSEITMADAVLKSVDGKRSSLFRFPYGANNDEGLTALSQANLISVMWNIDSLDWADPVPTSIADRVLRLVDQEGRGIILFHDIHDRTVKALPKVLDRLVAEGYRFAGWDGKDFTVPKEAELPVGKLAMSTEYGDSWAIVIGIDNYDKWPKLQYAARDAEAVRTTLIEQHGFTSERVLVLQNEAATRNAILSLFHERLAHDGVKSNDRLFVFFAGHGATRKLSSGRELGYIVPVDSDPATFASDAIAMSDIQNIAESLTAKHVLFVMDACYSGLGLTRGAGSGSYLKENSRRLGRQMLTAGGADQLVADGGPNGHSVFTWALLQALTGKGDLNGDSLITATELAAYLAPAVSSISQQTPAFGSLPGSEGGEFIFELSGESEFLNPQTEQLQRDEIAMNKQLDAASQLSATAPVKVLDLQGKAQELKLPKAVSSSMRQLAQRANDKGLQLYREQQYAAAEAQFTEALKYRPDFALAANNLGYIYFQQGKYQEAVRWYEKTLQIDPSRSVAYRNLGDVKVKLGQIDQAKQAFNTYLELAPTGVGADYVRAELAKL
ncbi:polysaccharide deacetylase family protein [Permianibacter sp. IMCC34836]|nr:polysaccharide deacetylase family protein [Permianibacter fluminis]